MRFTAATPRTRSGGGGGLFPPVGEAQARPGLIDRADLAVGQAAGQRLERPLCSLRGIDQDERRLGLDAQLLRQRPAGIADRVPGFYVAHMSSLFSKPEDSISRMCGQM